MCIRDRENVHISGDHNHIDCRFPVQYVIRPQQKEHHDYRCLLYTSDAADERSSVDLGGRRIIKKKKQE